MLFFMLIVLLCGKCYGHNGPEISTKNSANGLCPPDAITCNGVRDCEDGSDEDLSRCISEWRKYCMLSEVPLHTFCSYDKLTFDNRQFFYENEQIKLKCITGYKWIETIYYQCIDGEWLPPNIEFSENDIVCKIIKSKSTNIYCSYDNKNVSCDQPIKTGTVIHIKCVNGYEKIAHTYPDVIHCDKFGKWDFPIYKCQLVCGKVQKTNIENMESKTSIKDFPWHANVYIKSTFENKFKYICGGTIINSRVIVSASHCFWNDLKEKFNKPSLYLIGCGKSRQEFDQDEAYQPQFFEILFYAHHKNYNEDYYQHDIIFLILKKSIYFQPHILPICLNSVQYGLDKVIILSDEIGLIASRVNDGTSNMNGILKKIKLPIISKEKCQMELPDEYLNFLTDDKFCAGYSKPRSSVCVGDSGSGLIIEQQVKQDDKRYFLKGIVSNGFLPYDDCNNVTYTLFTSFQFYLNTAYSIKVFF